MVKIIAKSSLFGKKRRSPTGSTGRWLQSCEIPLHFPRLPQVKTPKIFRVSFLPLPSCGKIFDVAPFSFGSNRKTPRKVEAMKSFDQRSRSRNKWYYAPVAILCASLALPLDPNLLAQSPQAQSPVITNTTTQEESPKIPNDQLDSLVSPIALYPDHLLSQVLVASTYPLEIIQLEQWMKKNSNLKDKALADAVAKQPWDPSIQALAAFPDVMTRLAENISWTSDLGNAFLAQQSDVMDAVQRMRMKAKGTGNLQTNQQQKVETQRVEGGKEVVVIEQANPQVVYVPAPPVVVYRAPVCVAPAPVASFRFGYGAARYYRHDRW